MALGILSDEDLEKELNKTNSPKGEVRDSPNKGRGDKLETPESARKLISELAINGNDVNQISEEFGISLSSISAYKNGANSTASYNQPDEKLRSHTNLVRDRIVKRARRKLNLALENITEDKLANAKVRDLSGIAKDMSQVIRNMEPDEDPKIANNNQFIFMVPAMAKEDKYPIIDVSE
jgi:hypothetical protein